MRPLGIRILRHRKLWESLFWSAARFQPNASISIPLWSKYLLEMCGGVTPAEAISVFYDLPAERPAIGACNWCTNLSEAKCILCQMHARIASSNSRISKLKRCSSLNPRVLFEFEGEINSVINSFLLSG